MQTKCPGKIPLLFNTKIYTNNSIIFKYWITTTTIIRATQFYRARENKEWI
jgi:hypothetical protein